MDDFRLMYKILTLLLACEEDEIWQPQLFSPQVLEVPPKKRDATLRRMQDEGLIDHVVFDCYLHQPSPVLDLTHAPTITIKGIAFLEENSLMQKIKQEMKQIALSLASETAKRIFLP